jgi:predicted nucleotidyltransferase component of viral defense system
VVFNTHGQQEKKIRALYQRSKGRDLFDLWVLTTEVGVDPSLVCDAFSSYKPNGYTGKKAILNLDEKLRDTGFRSDISNLVSKKKIFYDTDKAAETIVNVYLINL